MTLRYCAGCQAPLLANSRTNRKWCSDHCRRHTSYSKACVDCGRPTYSGNAHPADRCNRCAPVYYFTVWTREVIVETIRVWVRTYGKPPTATDWNPSQAIALGHPEKAARFYEDNAWPHVNTVQLRFGSWNAAIEAAGFTPFGTGQYGRAGESMELCREIRARYEAGESSGQLGATYGVSPQTILRRVRKAGGTIRTVGQAVRLRNRTREGTRVR